MDFGVCVSMSPISIYNAYVSDLISNSFCHSFNTNLREQRQRTIENSTLNFNHFQIIYCSQMNRLLKLKKRKCYLINTFTSCYCFGMC